MFIFPAVGGEEKQKNFHYYLCRSRGRTELKMKSRIPAGINNRGAGNMNDMMRQAQAMQTKITEVQEEIDNRVFNVTVGGGMIALEMKGSKEILSVTINPEVVDKDDVETLQDLVMSAVNEGIKQINATSEEEMGKITGGVSFPGLF
jgi:DNA-binding YbaB/EbfC family protein